MSEKRHILIVEDKPEDAELVQYELKRAGLDFEVRCVDNKEAYLRELDAFRPDAVLADYSLPDLDAMTALDLLNDRRPLTPLIVVTGTLTEETAVDCMLRGVADYVLKDHLAKLGPAVSRSLERRAEREARKRAEEALRESEAKYSALIKYAGDAILIMDENARIVESNMRAEVILGYSAAELSGMDFISRHVETDRQKADGHFKLVSSAKKRAFYEAMLTTKDGITIPVEILINVVEYIDKRVVNAVIRDVSERKKAEVLKVNVIRDITHKLKTPIATATMACDLVEEALQKNDDELQKSSLKLMLGSVKRLRSDVDRMMDFFRMAIERPVESPGPTSLKALLDRILSEEGPLARAKGLQLTASVSEEADEVRVLETDLYVLFGNLIDNAIKFTKQGGVAVTAERTDGRVRIAVEDAGAGIPAEILPRVFEEFFQANAALPGMGLGLPICKQIVDRYNGTIAVHSEGAGKGTRVIVELPS
ncbi:MAG: ATP-binding protein [bacterium]